MDTEPYPVDPFDDWDLGPFTRKEYRSNRNVLTICVGNSSGLHNWVDGPKELEHEPVLCMYCDMVVYGD